MPAVSVLDKRISFFQEGDWNESEREKEWIAWDKIAPIEMANLTAALNSRCAEVYSWMEDVKKAPRTYQISKAQPSTTPFTEIENINDPNYQGPKWDEITLALLQKHGIRTSTNTLKKETNLFQNKIKSWIHNRMELKETEKFRIWKEDCRHFERAIRRYHCE